MLYVKIYKRDISIYDENGESLDGDRRVIREYSTDEYTWFPEDGNPVDWAVAIIGETDATEPSSYPIGSEVPERCWLSGTYEHPYENTYLETSAYVVGSWTSEQRAEIFRRASHV